MMNVELSDGRILVRPYRADDINSLYEAVRESITEVSRWMPWCHEGYTVDEASAFILSREEAWKSQNEYGFGIFDAETGKFLGGVGLNFINRVHNCGNLGYWVRTSAAGRGVASRAARLVARFGLEEIGLQRIEILAAVDNLASQRAAEKAGARLESALLRKRLRNKEQPVDARLYSLVSEDFI
jgi:RimJ/RimL family protein N-acetyltransferase